MKAFRPLFLLVLVVSLVMTNTALAASVSSWGDPSIPYGQRFPRLIGDLSRSGLPGINERPAILDRWEAYFVDVVNNKALNYLDKYDVYDIQEVNEGDDFTDRRGYGLIPQEEDVIKRFVTLANGNPDHVWNIVKNYSDVNQEGFYLLGAFIERPYISMGHLVELSGGAFGRLKNNYTGDPGKINGTVYFNVSPWPKINSATIDGDKVQISFTTYGLNDRHRPKVTITNGSDQIVKDFGYTSQHIYNGTWSVPLSDVERLGPPDTLKVVVEDGFGRTAEAPLKAGVDYYVAPFKEPVRIKMFADEQTTTVKLNIAFSRKDSQASQVPYKITITGPGGTVTKTGANLKRNEPLFVPYNFNVGPGTYTIRAEIWPQPQSMEANPQDNTTTITVIVEKLPYPKTGPKEPQIHVELVG